MPAIAPNPSPARNQRKLLLSFSAIDLPRFTNRMVAPAIGNYNSTDGHSISGSFCPFRLAGKTAEREMSAHQEKGVSDRKYRQRGYQDSGEDRQKTSGGERPAKKDTFGPRPVQMPGTH